MKSHNNLLNTIRKKNLYLKKLSVNILFLKKESSHLLTQQSKLFVLLSRGVTMIHKREMLFHAVDFIGNQSLTYDYYLVKIYISKLVGYTSW